MHPSLRNLDMTGHSSNCHLVDMHCTGCAKTWFELKFCSSHSRGLDSQTTQLSGQPGHCEKLHLTEEKFSVCNNTSHRNPGLFYPPGRIELRCQVEINHHDRRHGDTLAPLGTRVIAQHAHNAMAHAHNSRYGAAYPGPQ